MLERISNLLENKYEEIKLVEEEEHGVILRAKNQYNKNKEIIKAIYYTQKTKNFLLSEIQNISELEHNSLVRLNNFFAEESKDLSVYFICQEYHEQSLAKYIYLNQGMDPRIYQKQIAEIAEAVKYLLSNNISIIQLDPTKIYINSENIPKIRDYGILEIGGSPIQNDSNGINNLPLNNLEHNENLYVWVIGCLLYYMIQGKPFVPEVFDIKNMKAEGAQELDLVVLEHTLVHGYNRATLDGVLQLLSDDNIRAQSLTINKQEVKEKKKKKKLPALLYNIYIYIYILHIYIYYILYI